MWIEKEVERVIKPNRGTLPVFSWITETNRQKHQSVYGAFRLKLETDPPRIDVQSGEQSSQESNGSLSTLKVTLFHGIRRFVLCPESVIFSPQIYPFCNIYFISILDLYISRTNCVHPSVFRWKVTWISHVPNACYIYLPSYPSFHHPNNNLWSAKVMHLFTVHFVPSPCCSHFTEKHLLPGLTLCNVVEIYQCSEQT
jgi:hypothetical protein